MSLVLECLGDFFALWEKGEERLESIDEVMKKKNLYEDKQWKNGI